MRVLLGVIGLGVGSSAFFFGYYETTVWEPICFAFLALLLASVVSQPLSLGRTDAFAISGLLALWLWSLLSRTWAEAGDAAVTVANRWLLYAVVLTVLLLLLRGPASRRVLIGTATAGVLAMAAFILIRLLLEEGSTLFFGNRLNGPLEYVNGEATYLLVGLWPVIAFTERTRSPVLGGLGVFAGVQLLSLALLTQSRGGLLALVVSTAVVLAVVPGRLPRAWALMAMLAGAALALPALRDVIDPAGGTVASDTTLRAAATATLLAGAGIGVAWTVVKGGLAALSRREPRFEEPLRTTSIALIVVLGIAGCAAALVPPGHRIDQIGEQYEAFTQLRAVEADGRLASGGGNRFDYWRVGWMQFKDDPLRGVGAGNYDRTYFLERRTTENITQAHSVELQVLGETGLVGGVAFAAFAGAVLIAFWRRARDAGALADPAIAVAAGGMFFVWLTHTSVDWAHLIPGLTGIALCAAASLLNDQPRLPLRRPALAAGLIVVATAAAAFPVVRQAWALHLRSEGHDRLSSEPLEALRKANDSLALQDSAQTHYLKAAAYARLGFYRPARNALIVSTRSEPHNFVTWTLLGDLAKRRGDAGLARHYYRRSSRLNPLEPALLTLANEGATAKVPR